MVIATSKRKKRTLTLIKEPYRQKEELILILREETRGERCSGGKSPFAYTRKNGIVLSEPVLGGRKK